MSATPVVTRFAPSPTGELHLGNARAALQRDLSWLGIAWDGEPRRQSAREQVYAASLRQLVAGGQAYPCFRTPQAIELARRALDPAAAPAPEPEASAAIAAAVKAGPPARGAALFRPLRAALTGRLHGPEPGPLLGAFAPGEAERRLRRHAEARG